MADPESRQLRFWVQTVTGNWSPELAEHVSVAEYGLSVIFAIAVNLSPIVGAYLLLRDHLITSLLDQTRERESRMNMVKALSVKTVTTKMTVLAALPQDDQSLTERVEQAFSQAETVWKRRLQSMIGDEQARVVFDAMEKEIPLTEPSPSMTAR